MSKDKKPYKIMKVFDPHFGGMPKKVADAFMKLHAGNSNNTMITYRMNDHEYEDEMDLSEPEEGSGKAYRVILHKWLVKNDVAKDESIVIKYWW